MPWIGHPEKVDRRRLAPAGFKALRRFDVCSVRLLVRFAQRDFAGPYSVSGVKAGFAQSGRALRGH
jgi:hypothetical protein